MFTLRRFPFVWITMPFIFGIIAGENNSHPIPIYGFIILLAATLLALYKANHYIFILSLILLMFLTGWKHTFDQKPHKGNYEDYFLASEIKWSGKIESVRELENYWRLEIIDLVPVDHCYQEITPRTLVYLQKVNTKPPLELQTLFFTGKLQPIPAPVNPGEFNFKRFLSRKGIQYQVFVDSAKWHTEAPVRKVNGGTIIRNIRTRAIQSLRSAFPNGAHSALMSALFLGKKEDLSEETLVAFSNTGARHLLAVSGMHVGMIMLLLSVMLNFFPSGKVWKIFKSILIIGLIWFYAWLTGAQPATLRAAFMFSVFPFGRILHLEGSGINSLFFSAFAFLVHDPFILFSLGFIFSYTALLSILVFFPFFDRLYRPRYFLPRYFWQLGILSLSAQVLMLPVALFYFHKIPLLFLFSSMVSTPLAFLIIACLIPFFLDQMSGPVLELFIVPVLETLCNWFLMAIHFLDQLPFGTIQRIHLSSTELWLILISILWFYLAIFWRKYSLFIWSFLFLDLFLMFRHADRICSNNQDRLVLYADRRFTQLDIFHGQTCYVWLNDDGGPQETPPGQYDGLRIRRQSKDFIKLDSMSFLDSYLQFYPDHIVTPKLELAVISTGEILLPDQKQLDLLIWDRMDNSHLNCILERLLSEYKIGTWIITARIPATLRRMLTKELQGQLVVNVAESGAFDLKLN